MGEGGRGRGGVEGSNELFQSLYSQRQLVIKRTCYISIRTGVSSKQHLALKRTVTDFVLGGDGGGGKNTTKNIKKTKTKTTKL